MNSNILKIVAAVIVSAVIWLVGVLVFGGTIGMISVLISISLAGYVAGQVMNTACTTSTLKH